MLWKAQISPAHADLIRAIVTKYGGRWEPTPTENVTYLIADTVSDSIPVPRFISTVVSHKWIRDSFKSESRQDIAPSRDHFEPWSEKWNKSPSRPPYPQPVSRHLPVHTPCAPYVLFERSGDAPSTARPSCPVAFGGKAKSTARIPNQCQLPFLPHEIVMKIHLMCRDLALDDHKAHLYINTLLRISHVCQRWRSIAHGNLNPPLWTHIFLDFHTKKAYTRLSKLAEVGWIARSGSYPLSVNVRSYFPCAPNPVVDFLLAHASRIRNLSLELPAKHLVQNWPPALKPYGVPSQVYWELPGIPYNGTECYQAGVPNLLALPSHLPDLPVLPMLPGSTMPTASCYWGYPPPVGLTFHRFLHMNAGSFPALETIVMTALPRSNCEFDPTEGMTRAEFFAEDMPYGEPDPGLLWAGLSVPVSAFQDTPKLRDITINAHCKSVEMGVRDTRHVLQLLVNARNLSFYTGSSQGPIMPPMQAVQLPVTQLNWCGLCVHDTSIFASLVLPSLTSLQLRDASEETLCLLRERAPFELDKLDVTFTRLSFSATAPFLRNMHTLTVLELKLSIALTDELMEFLTYDARTTVLPALKDLALFDRRKYFHERAMLRMVESRWLTSPGVPLLRRVRVTVKPLPGRFAYPGSPFESRAVVPSGLTVIPVLPPYILLEILDRIAEMNEEGLSLKYEIVM
ncbi:hypothetical protein B0H12DRAFT_1075549 [Mycena haematopus]|nr:hypothetical protein B0H12DRAFT_1075549 [Mycena haematopus]